MAAVDVAGGEVRRKRVEFHPSVWNDFFARPDNHSPLPSTPELLSAADPITSPATLSSCQIRSPPCCIPPAPH
ncbi:unnamed protein product [Linum tenue]|uniref:Uncharacterized protein n=1 Tax=Linum tenue TaxID=586396 RepID=A0AAV0H2E3_9ROSI|nr:unnamed protein product [Linum tenue]